jgi:2-iminobutanoate/2-iminopropanoate deaminase
MAKQQIRSDKLRPPSGVFSHATMIEAKGRLVFISGMTARRADGTIAGIGDIEAQTRQVCENIKAAVESAGGTMDDICRVDVYIRNMEQFDAIHKVRRELLQGAAAGLDDGGNRQDDPPRLPDRDQRDRGHPRLTAPNRPACPRGENCYSAYE